MTPVAEAASNPCRCDRTPVGYAASPSVSTERPDQRGGFGQLRHEADAPSIGLILCKTRNKVIAEYALRNIATPVGIAGYTTKLRDSLPAELKGSLPSPQDIEAEMRSDESKDK